MKTFIIIPTYNEAQNIPLLLDEILKRCIENLNILVVDDNSPDGTWRIVEELAKKHKKVHLLLRKENKGRGLAGIDGFKYALANGADIVIEMDADFSHHPKHISEFLEAIKNADVVAGSRFIASGADKRKWDRKILTILCNGFANTVLGLKMSDPNSGYRCYRRRALESIVPRLNAKGADIVQDVIYNCRKEGFNIKEIPIDFKDREFGETTKTFSDFMSGAITVLKLRLGVRP
ncbi:MAG TPA: polyprenol monophosphomannose synthase [Nanoarchaeota archaeon]|nr:polyprenol monophosphomannose synthase [Nanoarchaeota archaeon]